MTPLFKCENVSMGYEGISVIQNLSFAVNRGDYICIVGENGSGKTTLMLGILGLICVNQGEIVFDKNFKRDEIGYLPQQSNIQRDFPASVFEIVLSGTITKNKHSPFYSKKQKNLALNCMRKVDIECLKNKCYRELSGGQQQRVMLARALCSSEKLLILDEPVTGLDPIATNDFYSLVSKLNRDGMTIVMVSHDITSSVNHASYILHLGKDNYFYGTTHAYIRSDLGSKFLITGCPCDSCSHGKGN